MPSSGAAEELQQWFLTSILHSAVVDFSPPQVPAPQNEGTKVGQIAGGVVGGLLLAALVFVVFKRSRRRKAGALQGAREKLIDGSAGEGVEMQERSDGEELGEWAGDGVEARSGYMSPRADGAPGC